MNRRQLLLTAIVAGMVVPAFAATIVVDASKPLGTLRPLHGVNGGPLHLGETLDLSPCWKEVGFPLARLHDCHWPAGDVVDVHSIFPNPEADPSRPESYDFRRTDDYLAALLATGSQVVFRLGESIEHSKRKYHVHPPRDADRWAQVCVGIVRHYNDGWAGGFYYKIVYWEVWNEPENRPAMWTGDDADYFRLYAATARAIKQRFPQVKIGGPAVGNLGQLEGDRLRPSAFTQAFLAHVKQHALPLDFFSWHTYTNDPRELAQKAREVRRLLDEYGLAHCENHLNEWNYLPENDWGGMLTPDARRRELWFAQIGGAPGAAFTASALMLLQDAPLDVANYYSADIQGFGLFNAYGVPLKCYSTFRAFRRLLDTPRRLTIEGMPGGLTAVAGTSADGRRIHVLLARQTGGDEPIELHVRKGWAGGSRAVVRRIDAAHDFDAEPPRDVPAGAAIPLLLTGPSVCLVELEPVP